MQKPNRIDILDAFLGLLVRPKCICGRDPLAGSSWLASNFGPSGLRNAHRGYLPGNNFVYCLSFYAA